MHPVSRFLSPREVKRRPPTLPPPPAPPCLATQTGQQWVLEARLPHRAGSPPPSSAAPGMGRPWVRASTPARPRGEPGMAWQTWACAFWQQEAGP